MRTKEVETEGGMLSVEISAIEYVSSIYDAPVNTQQSLPRANITIPRIPVMPPGAIITPIGLQGTYGNLSLPSKFGSILVNEQMAELGAGVQLADSPANNTSVVSGTVFKDIIPEESYDITNSDIGDYEFTSSATVNS